MHESKTSFHRKALLGGGWLLWLLMYSMTSSTKSLTSNFVSISSRVSEFQYPQFCHSVLALLVVLTTVKALGYRAILRYSTTASRIQPKTHRNHTWGQPHGRSPIELIEQKKPKHFGCVLRKNVDCLDSDNPGTIPWHVVDWSRDGSAMQLLGLAFKLR